MRSRPTPGHAKMVSVMTAPVSTAPNWRPSTVTIGMRLFLNACLSTARTRDTPRARRAKREARPGHNRYGAVPDRCLGPRPHARHPAGARREHVRFPELLKD